ncbi:cyclin-D-binding Myb-like transcription factor 1 isoform X1 [Paramormyrops kingsleyae]|uniref:Cyclin-D-binding Myb-like transcription factor 1 n=1 Tax=Paramormyrops kingsleyae TaxID=1676925 RepID=A0A3B3SYZ5_9TELE|nr:cyclin-D-binding Myb-like transcription factor 1 isoform X1 [Paramormyrops kingsleyae]
MGVYCQSRFAEAPPSDANDPQLFIGQGKCSRKSGSSRTEDEAEHLGPDESLEPAHKRLCLSNDDELHVSGSAPRISVVTLPISENDESFEVTMTATTEMTEGDMSEGAVAQIQILQNDDTHSPQKPEEASPVSQAWFTTKEDKVTLVNKGHKWKQGMWSKEEIDILMSNIDQYIKSRGIQDPTEIIFEMSKDERKDFYRSIAWGLNRPLFAVYRRVLRMYDNRNHVGKYTPEEIDKLKELREKHGNDWATIGAALGRSASSVKDRCRLMKDTCNTGKWTEEEEQRLAEVVHELTGTEPGHAVTQGVSWASVAELVGTRSEKQCRSKWLNYLNWKQSGGTEWTKEDDMNLIGRIVELQVNDENEINWDVLAGGWSSVRSPQWLRSKWWTIKRQVSNHKELPLAVLLKGLQDLAEHQQPYSKVVVGSPRAGSTSPSSGQLQQVQIRVARLEESGATASSPMGALQIPVQIPVQITHVSSSEPSFAANDSDTITLNAGAMQAFEILPSFHLQPTGTPGTYYIQTGSSSGLPLTVSASSTVTLTASATPSSPEQIIVHGLSADSLLSSSDNVAVQMANPGVIIQTVSSDELASPAPLEASEDVDGSLAKADEGARSPRTHATSPGGEKFLQSSAEEDEEPTGVQEHLADSAFASEPLETQVVEGAVGGSAVLIVPSPNTFIQAADDIVGDSVLPLTALTDPILENQGESSD